MFHLLLNGIRGALHPSFLERRFVLGVHHCSEGHQLKFIVLNRDSGASLQGCFVLFNQKDKKLSTLKAGMESDWCYMSESDKNDEYIQTKCLTLMADEYCSECFWHSSILLFFCSISATSTWKRNLNVDISTSADTVKIYLSDCSHYLLFV